MIRNDEDEKKELTAPQQEKETLLKTRTIMLFGEVNKDSANAIINSFIMLDNDDSSKPIWLYINSPGGEVDSGFAIYDIIKFVKSPVYVLGVGLVASAASLIYASVPRERRYALEHSTYLIHQPLAKMQGVAIDVQMYADRIDEIKLLINKILSQASNQSLEKVTQDTDRDYYMTSKEAKDYGLVGNIVVSKNEIRI